METAIDRLFLWMSEKCPQVLWNILEKVALKYLKKVDECAVCLYWRARFHGWLDLLIVIGVIYVFSQA